MQPARLAAVKAGSAATWGAEAQRMGNASIVENDRGPSLALRPLHLVKEFLLSALLLIPVFGLLGMGVLVLAASAFPSS